MNTTMLTILKQIIAQYGEAVLEDSSRFKNLLADLAVKEPRPQRLVLVKCVENGYHRELQKTPEDQRGFCKKRLADKLHRHEGLDLTLCGDTLDVLAAALFGEETQKHRCRNCGKELEPTWKTCPYCGTLVNSQPVTDPQVQSAVIPPERNNMVHIQGGTFMMGSPSSEVDRRDNEVQHQVTISDFWVGKYEVTQKEYQEIMGNNPSHFKGDNLPVEQVSWFEALNYCNARSGKEALTHVYTFNGETVTWNPKANGYRLPTEAEWEYACRGGTTTPYYQGATTLYYKGSSLDNISWHRSNSGGKTHPVGEKEPNAWGLYDMLGNVWEWCWDWYGDYSAGLQTDPAGVSSGSSRVRRGGSWDRYGQYMRSANRGSYYPSNGFNGLGFRVVRSGNVLNLLA